MGDSILNYLNQEFIQRTINALEGTYSEEEVLKIIRNNQIVDILNHQRHIPADNIVKSCQKLDFSELYIKAQKASECDILYNIWSEAYNSYNNHLLSIMHRELHRR